MLDDENELTVDDVGDEFVVAVVDDDDGVVDGEFVADVGVGEVVAVVAVDELLFQIQMTEIYFS